MKKDSFDRYELPEGYYIEYKEDSPAAGYWLYTTLEGYPYGDRLYFYKDGDFASEFDNLSDNVQKAIKKFYQEKVGSPFVNKSDDEYTVQNLIQDRVKGDRVDPKDAYQFGGFKFISVSSNEYGDKGIVKYKGKKYNFRIRNGKTEVVKNDEDLENPFTDDIVKTNKGWTNKGKEGTHGTFHTKKAARQQQKAMFANGYKDANYTEEEKRITESIRYVFYKDLDILPKYIYNFYYSFWKDEEKNVSFNIDLKGRDFSDHLKNHEMIKVAIRKAIEKAGYYITFEPGQIEITFLSNKIFVSCIFHKYHDYDEDEDLIEDSSEQKWTDLWKKYAEPMIDGIFEAYKTMPEKQFKEYQEKAVDQFDRLCKAHKGDFVWDTLYAKFHENDDDDDEDGNPIDDAKVEHL